MNPMWVATCLLLVTYALIMQTTLQRSLPAALVAAGLLLSAGAVFGASPDTNADIQARYERERAVCLNGKSNQDQATCLKEAGAARDVARRGLLDEGNADYRRNQLDRCKALSGEEAKDCRPRMLTPSIDFWATPLTVTGA